jgi:hypothetical protein
MSTPMHRLGRHLAGRWPGRGRPRREVRILDAKHLDGPESLAAILGFLGVHPHACLIPPSRAAAGPGGSAARANGAW